MPETDVLYMTRIQKERFSSLDEYEKVGLSCHICIQHSHFNAKMLINVVK